MNTAKNKHARKSNGSNDPITIAARMSAAGYVHVKNGAGIMVWVPRVTGSHIPRNGQRKNRKDARRAFAAGSKHAFA